MQISGKRWLIIVKTNNSDRDRENLARNIISFKCMYMGLNILLEDIISRVKIRRGEILMRN